MSNKLLNDLNLDYLLVCCTNEFLVEYPALSENARYTLTGFSGSTGDALMTKDKIYLFVDGRYHTQADNEVKEGVTVVKLKLGQKQDDEIRKLVRPDKTLGVVAKKISQARLETFKDYKIKLLDKDPINDFTESHNVEFVQAMPAKEYYPENPTFVTNLEEVSYISGKRDFSKDCSSKIWAKLYADKEKQILLTDNTDEFLKNFDAELIVDKNSINAHDYSLIKNPIHKFSEIKSMKSVKSKEELDAYKKAFERTDKAVFAIREFIENNDNLSEYDIAKRLREEFIKFGAKSLSFNSIVAINQNSALAHYAKNAKDVILKDGSLVLIDCGAYYESGLATDITRVFVKGKPNELQKRVYTTVLKAFLNSFNYLDNSLTRIRKAQHSFANDCSPSWIIRGVGGVTSDLHLTGLRPTENPLSHKGRGDNAPCGFKIDTLAHSILDNKIEGFTFGHGLGHGIGINVHEAPPNLSQNEIAKTQIVDGMTFTIEPGLYNPEHFGVRLENSCYMECGKIHSFVKMGYEGKLINYDLLDEQEKEWLKDFKIL